MIQHLQRKRSALFVALALCLLFIMLLLTHVRQVTFRSERITQVSQIETSGTLFLLHGLAPASSPQACTIARPSSPAERAVPNCDKLSAAL